ncbi:hypothetical protein Cantr_00763 [Candida viswanathii]|uniref:Uncharacterized protein n=1 Tax=Candida viswanathii TaxID=5486 RepID=A0A367YJ08_9ASCO|nr:hypothetical protein Cantr_00763 [Candida viswanathii]
MATLFVFDVIPFGGGIAFMVHTLGRWQQGSAICLAIPGMVLHAATSIMVIVFAVFPLWSQGGYRVVFRGKKFLYGCIFLDEREQGVGGDHQESGLEFVEYGRGMVSTSTDETTVKNSN